MSIISLNHPSALEPVSFTMVSKEQLKTLRDSISLDQPPYCSGVLTPPHPHNFHLYYGQNKPASVPLRSRSRSLPPAAHHNPFTTSLLTWRMRLPRASLLSPRLVIPPALVWAGRTYWMRLTGKPQSSTSRNLPSGLTLSVAASSVQSRISSWSTALLRHHLIVSSQNSTSTVRPLPVPSLLNRS